MVILATQRQRVTVVLADPIEREVERVLDRKLMPLPPAERGEVKDDVQGWFRRVRLERRPAPTPDAIRTALPRLLPAIRHVNELPAVVAAIEAAPDWVISENQEHWNDRVAAVSGLRIVTPFAFLSELAPPVRQ